MNSMISLLVIPILTCINSAAFAKEEVKGAAAQYLYHRIGQTGLDDEYEMGIIHDIGASKIDCLEKKSAGAGAFGLERFSCRVEANGFSIPLSGAAALSMQSRIRDLGDKIHARDGVDGIHIGIKGVVCMIVTDTGNATCILESLY